MKQRGMSKSTLGEEYRTHAHEDIMKRAQLRIIIINKGALKFIITRTTYSLHVLWSNFNVLALAQNII